MDEIHVNYSDVLAELRDAQSERLKEIRDYIDVQDISVIMGLSRATVKRHADLMGIAVKQAYSPRAGKLSNMIHKDDAKRLIKGE